MKKYKIKQIYIDVWKDFKMFAKILFFILIVVAFIWCVAQISMQAHPETNPGCSTEEVCYKTECGFWGCNHVQVDIDSPQCETKETICRGWN